MTNKQNISIKGTKDGLIFYLNDNCSFDEIIQELRDKVEKTHKQFLNGPLMRVTIKTGFRQLSEEQHLKIKEVLGAKGNLIIQTIENEIDFMKLQLKSQPRIVAGVIRSGQIQQFEGSVLFLGDVNPGGNLLASGDIYILGSLKGLAHAGMDGNSSAIIVASAMDSMQIRIADVISDFSSNKEFGEKSHEFAYVNDGKIEFKRLQHLPKFRKDIGISF